MWRAHDSAELAVFLEEFADWIEKHLEDWTVTNNGVCFLKSSGTIWRIPPARVRRGYAHEGCDARLCTWQTVRPARARSLGSEIIDAGSLNWCGTAFGAPTTR